jgi:hypothetical protein
VFGEDDLVAFVPVVVATGVVVASGVVGVAAVVFAAVPLVGGRQIALAVGRSSMFSVNLLLWGV